MKLLKRLGKRQKKIGSTPDLYQNSIEKFGRDQLMVLSKKGLGIRLTAV